MKKHLTILLASAGLILLMTACPSPPDIMGSEPLMWGDHFMFDQVYDTGREIYTYNSDGTYEYLSKEWNSTNEEWELEWGSRGTYVYDNKTFQMVWTYEQEYGWDDEDKWFVLKDEYADDTELESWSKTETDYWYFTNNGMYKVYTFDTGNLWKSEMKRSKEETRSGTTKEDYWKSIKSFELSGTELMYTQNDFNKDYDSSTEQATYQREKSGPIHRIAPTGTSWEKGKTVTFYYARLTDHAREWNWDTEEWKVWDDYLGDSTDLSNRTLVHMGDFLLEVDIDSSKNMELKEGEEIRL